MEGVGFGMRGWENGWMVGSILCWGFLCRQGGCCAELFYIPYACNLVPKAE